jgi:hypothetical protein
MSLETVQNDERTTAVLNDLFSARHVAPVVALLAHESASCTGHSSGRRITRIFLEATEGLIWTEDPTPEMIRDGLLRIRIRGIGAFRTPGSVSGSMHSTLVCRASFRPPALVPPPADPLGDPWRPP